MHRTKTNYVPEEIVTPDEAQESLQATINLLQPIRDHRQMKSEREWRKEKQKLRLLEEKAAQKTAELATRTQQYHQEKQALATRHQQQSISQRILNDWLNQEKALLLSVETAQSELYALQQQCQQQQSAVSTARTQADRQRTDSERLRILTESIKENS
ncbi:hypothetical protein [Vibrio quintilis]|uniref:Type III secretion protein n=1 Tax=Vibrio quintilis TaxID=1117707 RepID=A0A1M7YSQ5_9VIBR|nr:hypothetical protein [Vibrio quintilis]SHO55652.1 hypothetical protein VQ7734_01398 [Vibrio quintilis]